MMLADKDYFPLSDDAQWKTVAAANAKACAAACSSSNGSGSKAACVMFRWNEAAAECQQVLEAASGSVMGFKVAQAADYVMYTVPADLEVGEQVGASAAKNLKQCVQACSDLNTCEGFSYPNGTAGGSCKLFASVLDADYEGQVHVAGNHLYAD